MTYEIINVLTTNTLSTHENEADAINEYEMISEHDREHQDSYAVIAFDDDGEATELVRGPENLANVLVAAH